MCAIKIFGSFVVTVLLGAWARAEKPNPVPDRDSLQAATPSLEKRLIETNIRWSEKLDDWADGIDLFLMGRRISTRKNETSIRIENSTYSMEGDNFRNTWNLHADVRLPNLEEYWRLKFTSYDDSEDRRGVRRDYLRQTPRQRNYGATLGFLRSLGAVKTMFSPRIELSSPLRVSHSLSFESVGEWDRYQVNPKLEFFANPDKGTGVYTALNFHVRLTGIYSLTFLNDGEYEENRNLFTANNGVSVGQDLSETMALSYNLMFNSNNRPHYHLNSYSFSIVWSHVLYKRMLDYEIIPHLDFDRAVSFKGRAGVIVNFNLTF